MVSYEVFEVWKIAQKFPGFGDEVRRQFEFPAAQYFDFKTNISVSQKFLKLQFNFVSKC